MTRGARARLALAALALVAILFVFVFPTRSYLAQRKQVSSAQHDVDLLQANRTTSCRPRRRSCRRDAAIERMAREQFHRVLPGRAGLRHRARRADAVGRPTHPDPTDSLSRRAFRRLAGWIPAAEHDVAVLTRCSAGRRAPASRSSCATRTATRS